MAYDVTEERLKVKGSERITRDLKVNRDAFINGKAETGSIDDKGDLKVAGEILAGDDVTISGDLYVNGTEYINDSETAQTTDNYLVLRHNQTTPLGTDEYSGVAVHNYASGKTATITTDKDGTWRVADNTETDTNYTNISYYDGVYYTELTRTATTVISGIKTAFDEDELDECVYYNTSYYHFDGNNWFPVSLVDNKLTLGSAITDSTIIAALNALTKEDLVYFRTLTITVISPVENQPLLTRAESSDLTGGQALTWDATNQKAVGKTIDTTVTADSSNLITSGAVKTAIDTAEANAKCLDNATGVLDITHGGTGATCAADARACLGLGDISTINANNCTIEFLRGDGTWAPPSSVASCADCGKNGSSYSAFGSAAFYNKKAGASGTTYVEYSGANGSCLLAGDFLAYWNGAYNSTGSSNLSYFCGGKFGTAAACAATAFRACTWTPTCVACAGLVYLDCFTASADRPVMMACPRGSTGFSDQGVSTVCPLTFNPATGALNVSGCVVTNQIFSGENLLMCASCGQSSYGFGVCTLVTSVSSSSNANLQLTARTSNGAGRLQLFSCGSGGASISITAQKDSSHKAELDFNSGSNNIIMCTAGKKSFCIDCIGRLHLKSGMTLCYDL